MTRVEYERGEVRVGRPLAERTTRQTGVGGGRGAWLSLGARADTLGHLRVLVDLVDFDSLRTRLAVAVLLLLLFDFAGRRCRAEFVGAQVEQTQLFQCLE